VKETCRKPMFQRGEGKAEDKVKGSKIGTALKEKDGWPLRGETVLKSATAPGERGHWESNKKKFRRKEQARGKTARVKGEKVCKGQERSWARGQDGN